MKAAAEVRTGYFCTAKAIAELRRGHIRAVEGVTELCNDHFPVEWAVPELRSGHIRLVTPVAELRSEPARLANIAICPYNELIFPVWSIVTVCNRPNPKNACWRMPPFATFTH